MFAGTGKRIASMWFPRFPSDRALRACPIDGPFALSLRQKNADTLYDLNPAAEQAGLARGMAVSEARAFCTNLIVHPADPRGDALMIEVLRRWALRYCPWVGRDGVDGLVLDITGAAHLMGGEAALRADMMARLSRAGFTVQIGIAQTRGAAWAMAHSTEGQDRGGILPDDQLQAILAPMPVALLRISPDMDTALQRLGLRRMGDLMAAPRAPLARRFGPDLLGQLDRALGLVGETVSPDPDPIHYAVRLTLPDPIGLLSDIEAGLLRLLHRLCTTLCSRDMGARTLCLSLRRVDQHAQDVPLRLAAPMRDPVQILPLFARGLDHVDAGFGIDQLRLEATRVEPMPARQIESLAAKTDRLDALITRIGSRIGLDHIRRFQPRDSHTPERGFALVPIAQTENTLAWSAHPSRPPSLRPLTIFSPEWADVSGHPPATLRWRGMRFTTGRATGPERIAPEWWGTPDPYGLRDYWRIDTVQGRRLWLFFTPQNPRWFVQGEFL